MSFEYLAICRSGMYPSGGMGSLRIGLGSEVQRTYHGRCKGDYPPMNDRLKSFVELLGEYDTAMLVTESPAANLVCRPMALQEPRADRALWFVTSRDTVSAHNVAANGKVNLAFHRKSDHAWVSVAGTGTLSADRNLIESLWKDDWSVWFAQGKDTPGIVLIEVDPQQIDFWEPERGKIGTLFQMAKAAVTDSSPDLPPTQTLKVSDLQLAGAMRGE